MAILLRSCWCSLLESFSSLRHNGLMINYTMQLFKTLPLKSRTFPFKCPSTHLVPFQSKNRDGKNKDKNLCNLFKFSKKHPSIRVTSVRLVKLCYCWRHANVCQQGSHSFRTWGFSNSGTIQVNLVVVRRFS